MTVEQTVQARRRLWLGITNVGFWVLTAVAGLGWLMGNRDSRPAPPLPVVAIGVLGVLGVQAVFDIVGGWALMPEPRRKRSELFRGWLQGVIVHSFVLFGVGVLGAMSIRWTGGVCLGIALSSVMLAFGKRIIHDLVCGASTRRGIQENGETVLFSMVEDPAFTGGIVGFGRHARSLMPAAWNRRESRADLAVESLRRRWQIDHGLPLRAFLLILSWNLVGAWAGQLAFGLGDLSVVMALIGLACWMTLWTFVSLLVLPFLGRGTVLAADRAALDSGLDPTEWIRAFPGITGENGSPRAAVQNIFYPIPSVEERLRALSRPRPQLVLGSLARGNLYLSWAAFTILGRAVHCNVGRPGLWVFPPTA